MQDGYSKGGDPVTRKFRVKVQGKIYEVEVEEIETTESSPASAPVQQTVSTPPSPPPQTPQPQPVPQLQAKQTQTVETTPSGEHVIKAPMPGLIIHVDVAEGNRVSVGQRLLVLEAMKMENDIIADKDGVIKEVHVKKGDNVELGQALVTIV